MQNSFLSLMTKAVTNWKVKDGKNKEEKKGIANYYDAVCTPDLSSSEKTAFVKEKIKDEMSAFFLDTSFTALTQIYKADSLWKRVVWTVMVIGMLAWMAVQCYWLLDKYYGYPMEVKMDLKVSTKLEFPSVTICNLNPIMEEKVLYEPYTELQRYVDPKIFDTLFHETLNTWQFTDVCGSDYMKCNNGRCVWGGFICDGDPDCKDGEDEQNCEEHQCMFHSWKCTVPPKCINILLRCNGFAGDCNKTLTEDEENCENNTCPADFFRCSSGLCVPKYFVCDGIKDCAEDELNCTEVQCGYGTVKCNNTNKCVNVMFLCDGDNDCGDYEDEAQCSFSANTTMGYGSTETWDMINTTNLQSSTTDTASTLLTSADLSRRKREALDNTLTDVTDDNIRNSRDMFQMYRDNTGKRRPYSDTKKDIIFRDSKAQWEANSGSTDREEFIQELHDSYLAFQKSEIQKNNRRMNTGSTQLSNNNAAHHRVKRHSRPSESAKNSSIKVDWESILQNSSFNKWNMLANDAMASNFYEERDDEYEAAMTYAYITAKLSPAEVEYSGHLKIDLIAACKFDGYQCSPANFTYFHSHKYGNCYTFNSKFANGTELYTRFPGPENGLRLELFLDQKNYVANLATEAGVRILVHKKGSWPFPEDEGLSIMPGRSTSVGIRQISYSRLPPPHGVCGNSGQTKDYYAANLHTDYSKLSCLKSCYQDIIIRQCHCAVPFYYMLENVTVCNMTDWDTEQCVTKLPVIYPDSYEICDKMCPVPCMETRYDTTISTAKWPSDKYKDYLQERLGQTNALYRQAEDSENEFTKLQIYFQDLIYEHVEQQKAYESMNLISDLGGQLGLWLGLSAITIGEICSFLFGVGRSLFYKRWGNKTTPIQNDLTPITTFEPATLQEMYEDMAPEPAKYIPPDMSTTLPGSTYVCPVSSRN